MATPLLWCCLSSPPEDSSRLPCCISSTAPPHSVILLTAAAATERNICFRKAVSCCSFLYILQCIMLQQGWHINSYKLFILYIITRNLDIWVFVMSILCYPFLDISLSHIPAYCTSNFRSSPLSPSLPPLPPSQPSPPWSFWMEAENRRRAASVRAGMPIYGVLHHTSNASGVAGTPCECGLLWFVRSCGSDAGGEERRGEERGGDRRAGCAFAYYYACVRTSS